MFDKVFGHERGLFWLFNVEVVVREYASCCGGTHLGQLRSTLLCTRRLVWPQWLYYGTTTNCRHIQVSQS
jgi:hypothetical protein